MPGTPEQRAREQIEVQLLAAGWGIQDANAINLGAASGVAILTASSRSTGLREGLGTDAQGISINLGYTPGEVELMEPI